MDKPVRNEKFTIAVVGGGAACVAFLHHFSELISPEAASRIRIKIFEPRGTIGRGLAYQHDCESLLLNRAVETMSVSASDFSSFTSWVRWKAHHEDELKALARRDLSATYVPRALFGRYLDDFFRETSATAARKGLTLQVEQREVTAVRRATRYRLETDGAVFEADTVLLAIGNIGQHDHYGLLGHERYLHEPYPLALHLDRLSRAGKVAILGSGLTAVDVACSLFRMRSDVEIDMLSPSGILPYVKGRQVRPDAPRFLTGRALQALTAGGTRKIGLRSLARLLRAEFRAKQADWRELFASADDALTLLRDEIAHADRERAWQTVLVATNEVVEEAWHALEPAAQALVLQRFARPWLARRAPMPLENARLLAAMLENGRLKLLRTPAEFERGDPARLGLRLGDGSVAGYDYVVNATGAAKTVRGPQDSRLAWQLLREGLASPDWRGGLQVDFNTGALLDAQGEADWQLRCLGHLTCGAYFFVSSLEMVAKRARRIASDLASALSEEDMALHAAELSRMDD